MLRASLISTALLLSTPVIADPILICEWGGTMVLVVEREDYAEEPASIMKIVVWNGATRNANEDGSSMTDICSVLDVAMVEYIHTTNEVVIDGVRVEYPNSEDLVTVTPLILFTIENQAREIEENTRQEFYVYEALLG